MSPKVHLPLGSHRTRKSLGKEHTFFIWKGQQKVKSYAIPTGYPSLSQISQRLWMKTARQAWQALSQAEKDAWEVLAKKEGNPWSGYTLFMSHYMLPGVSAPIFVSAGTNSAGTVITITFDKAMYDPAGKHSEFSFKQNGTPRAFSSAALNVDPTKIDLTVDGAPITYGTILLVSYTKGTVLAADGGILESFIDQAVTNNVSIPAPIFVSAETNLAGTAIAITFDKAMADPADKHSEFSFKQNGTPRAFSSAALNVDPTKIDLTVDGAPITYGTTLLVSYTKGTVLAADGGILESFTDQAVANNVPAPEESISIFNFRIPGRYHSSGITGPNVIRVVGSNTIYALPFFCDRAHSFDRIAYYVTKAAAGGLARLGVYLDNGSIYPGNLVLASAELPATPAGLYQTVVDWTSEAGKLYWLAFLSNKAPTVKAMSDYCLPGSPFGYAAAMGTYQDNYYFMALAYSPLPVTFPAGANLYSYSYVPAVFLRTV